MTKLNSNKIIQCPIAHINVTHTTIHSVINDRSNPIAYLVWLLYVYIANTLIIFTQLLTIKAKLQKSEIRMKTLLGFDILAYENPNPADLKKSNPVSPWDIAYYKRTIAHRNVRPVAK